LLGGTSPTLLDVAVGVAGFFVLRCKQCRPTV
jgi:hypothetical protein